MFEAKLNGAVIARHGSKKFCKALASTYCAEHGISSNSVVITEQVQRPQQRKPRGPKPTTVTVGNHSFQFVTRYDYDNDISQQLANADSVTIVKANGRRFNVKPSKAAARFRFLNGVRLHGE